MTIVQTKVDKILSGETSFETLQWVVEQFLKSSKQLLTKQPIGEALLEDKAEPFIAKRNISSNLKKLKD